MKGKRILKVVKIVFFVALAITVFSAVVMRLWNWLIPPIFGLHTISYVQALGLLILSKILFGGRPNPGMHWHWRRRMMERWEQMSPEERARFREGMSGHCGSHFAPPAEPKAQQ
jgi:hypothetical protein